MIFGPRPESHVLPTERRVVRVRPHWFSLWKVMGQGFGVLLGLIAINWLLSLIGSAVSLLITIVWFSELLVLLYLIYHVIFWWEDRIMVTDKRFLRVRGVFVETVDMMPITKVTDMTHHTSLAGRILGYGTIRIESAGQMQSLELITFIPDHRAVFEAITKLVFGDTDKEPSNKLPRPKRGPFSTRKSSRAIDQDADVRSYDDLSTEWPNE